MEDKEKKIVSHWKSLAERCADPAHQDQLRDEFPALRPNRRDFLKIMGFSVTTAALAACTRTPTYKAVTYLNKPAEVTPGVANWYATTCAACTAACGLLAKVRDGRPIKIEGNLQSPLNSGGTCAVGQASVLSLYDGSRLQGPEWQGQKTTWPELDVLVRQKLSAADQAGKKIVFLSHTVVSPSTQKLIGEFLSGFLKSQHIRYDPISAAAILKAHERHFGAAILPAYHFEKAKVIVGVNADFLGTWLSPVEFTQQYVKNRTPSSEAAEMSRHIQFESFMSLTGTNADHRYPIEPRQEGLVLWGLLREIAQLSGERLTPLPSGHGLDEKSIKRVAQELWEQRGHSLVVSGSNEVAVQSLVNILNDRLGNIGTTIDLDNPSYQKQGNEEDLAQLMLEMERGEVGVLFLYGSNPVYELPQAKKFQENLAHVDLTVSFSLYKDETAGLVTVLAPDLHFLEAWNDAQPQASLYHLTQPTIAPLFETRAAQDSLLQWMGRETDYYHYLQENWQQTVFKSQDHFLSFESFWNQALHDGSWSLPKRPARAYSARSATGEVLRELQKKFYTDQAPYALYLYEKIGIRQGQHANNPWLQELPDAVSKVTWNNYANLAPAEAEQLGVSEGELIALELAGQTVTLPVYLQPGQPLKTIAVALGYGRTQAGKAGTGVGQNLYPFVGFDKETFKYHAAGLKVSKTGKKVPLALTQTHHYLDGRPIIKETTLPVYRKNPHAGNEDHVHLISLWPEQKYSGALWGMAIDLNTCTGCSACVIACQAENNVPVVGPDEVYRRREMHWLRIDRYYSGSPESPEVAHQPMLCQHCGHAPCETVCPVLATVHSSDGLNQQVYNRCVGTRYCANNCPYKVRRFNWFDYADNQNFDFNMNSDLGKMVLNPDIVVRSRGVMEKCSMCIQRIQEGKLQAKLAGRKLRDGDIKMACEQSCPANAIVFGNLNDPKSRISALVKDPRSYHVLEELNVRPVVSYLTKVRNRGEGS